MRVPSSSRLAVLAPALLIACATAFGGRTDGASSVVIKHDDDVKVVQPGPHEGTGETTAYRYFDEVSDAGVIFRKRALHPGASIGVHTLTHDEVYYVLSGRGALTVDGEQREIGAGTAVFMRIGVAVGIRQVGAEDLVIIVAYPPAS